MNLTAKNFVKQKNIDWLNSKSVTTKNISRTYKLKWTREAWTFMKQSNYSEKVFVIERLRKEQYFEGKPKSDKELGEREYRIGYYIVGKIGKAKGKWVWGQFCPMIPINDFNKLIEKAKKEKTIISTI
jgi:hypothetical protein